VYCRINREEDLLSSNLINFDLNVQIVSRSVRDPHVVCYLEYVEERKKKEVVGGWGTVFESITTPL